MLTTYLRLPFICHSPVKIKVRSGSVCVFARFEPHAGSTASLHALRTWREESVDVQLAQVHCLHSDGLLPAAAAQRPTGELKIAAEATGRAQHCALERRR